MPARQKMHRCKGPDCAGRTPLKFGWCPQCTAALADIRRALAAPAPQSDAARREAIHRRRAAGINETGRS
jgi:hypothetical protein